MNSGQPYILAIDQGTSSSRAILYSLAGEECRIASRELRTEYPSPGWVEQDPAALWQSVADCLAEVTAGVEQHILAVGITNQRETVLAWDRRTGEPLSPAIVWQCRRSAPFCQVLRERGLEELFRRRTGLLLDPYFSGTKIRWLLDANPLLRERAGNGDVVFGTVESFLLFRLTGQLGTEPSNASRTLLMDLERADWDAELCQTLGVDITSLCPVRPSGGMHGVARIGGFEVPVTAMLGDQQASLLGHGCLEVGQSKCTFGTGAFLLANRGTTVPLPSPGLLSTFGWSVKEEGKSSAVYASEGSIFVAGALIQWLRDKLGVIGSAAESERIARQVPDSAGVLVVPAFVGLGSPYWDSDARGAILNLTRESSAVHIVRASLEAIAHQVQDLLESKDFRDVTEIRIDGGMSRNLLFCEILASLCNRPVKIGKSCELTARGVALLAGVGCGVWRSLAEASAAFQTDSSVTTVVPSGDEEARLLARSRWRDAVARVRTNASG